MPCVGSGIGVGKRGCLDEIASIEGISAPEYVDIIMILVLENDGVSNIGNGIRHL